MGGSFYLGWLNPRETSLVIWGFERQRFKGSRQVFPSQITAKKIVKNEEIPQKKHLFARQGNNKTNTCK
jgi:hypothetical protein